MPIQHVYTQTVADGTATSVVRPSDWNSAHAYTLQDAVSLGGNTAGALANISSGTLILAGGNNITLSQNGNSVTISGPNAGGAQTGISGIIASDATYTSGSVYFSGNNITIASSVNGASQYVQLSGNPAQTNQSAIKGFGVSNTGATAGNTGISTGIDWVIAGSNLITLSQSTVGGGANTVWIQHPAWLTTAALSQDSSKYAGINGAITGGSITVNTSGVSINLPAYLTTADLSANSSKYAGTGFTSAGANISLSGTLNTGGLSLSASVAAQSNQSAIKAFGVSNTGQTAGNTGLSTGIDWVLAGSQSITLSQSTTAGGPNTIWFQHPAWLTTADLSANSSKYVQNWKLTGNTSGTTSSAQGTDLWFSGGNSITVSGNSNTIVFSVGAYLTTAMASNRGSDFVAASAAFAGTNASGTIASNGISVSVAAPGAAAENNWVNLLGANTSGNTTASGSTLGWSGGNGVTLSGTNNSQIVISVSTYSTVGTATSGYPVASANSIGTVTRWAAEDHRHAGIGGFGISTSGNTAGTTGSVQGTYWIQGGNSITVSQITSNNGSHTLVISAGAYITTARASTDAIGLNTAQTNVTWTVNSSGLSINAGGYAGTGFTSAGSNISLNGTLNTAGLSLSASVAQPPYMGWLEPYPLETATQSFAPVAGSWYLAPFTAYGSLSGGRVNFLAMNTGTANLFQDIGETAYKSATTGTLSQVYTFSAAMAIFSQGTGTNSTRLESVWSNSHSWGWSKVINVSTNAATNIAVSLAQSISYQSEIGSNGAYTNVQYANATSSTIANSSGASTLLSNAFSSGRNLISGSLVQPFGFSTTLTAGIYWMGYAWSTTRGMTTTGGLLASAPDFGFSGILGISRLAVDSLFRNFGSTASTARSQLIPYGVYTGAANMAPPTAIALSSDLSSLASQWVPYFAFNNRGLTK